MISPSIGSGTQAPAQTQLILVVDDDARVAELLSWVLGDDGLRVSVAGSGREALDRVGAERPALVILDLVLPDMDGHVLAAALSASQGPSLPILIFSANQRRLDRIREEGVHRWLPKPFDLEEFCGAVRELLDPARARPSVLASASPAP